MLTSRNYARLRIYETCSIGLLLMSLSGCMAVGPDYKAPALNLPVNWTEAGNGEVTNGVNNSVNNNSVTISSQDGLHTWWRSFNDPLLDRMVDQTLAQNQDIGIALARLRQARAERVQTASAFGPTILAGGSGETRRTSKALSSQPGGESRKWLVGLDASWELDLFGGTRRAVEAADAGIEAIAEDHRALQVSLVAELVSNYAGLRATQLRLAIAHDNIRTLREGERLADQAYRHGMGTLVDVMQARAERETAEAQPPSLEADIARFSHAIGVLAGGFPGDWRTELANSSSVLPIPARLPLSLPSEVMRQRPDIRADERRLAAATAQIGVAEAERFPRFSIPLGISSTVSAIHNLFSIASQAWAAGGQAGQSIYDGGRASAGVRAAQAKADAVKLVYERDVRLALRDVEDALTALTSERLRQASLKEAVSDSQKALEQATRLYGRGLSAYMPVLVAQRTVNHARDALALSQWEEVRGVVALYKSLGAGWSDAVSTEKDD
ncbi:efflux transporter outer membrane subunit [Desulfovibrio sp.]|uniref:efflux transporter outer membrane subunit n=1 Tax=Desulfovibrio sp. TaxID=885 RepID=UPI0025BE1975|nr:efflux transporter outer membrane subunit [Desulfovibrio sp.]